jgi:hypothetical protein
MPRHDEQSSVKVFGRQGGGTSITPAKDTGVMNPWGTELTRWVLPIHIQLSTGQIRRLNAP